MSRQHEMRRPLCDGANESRSVFFSCDRQSEILGRKTSLNMGVVKDNIHPARNAEVQRCMITDPVSRQPVVPVVCERLLLTLPG